MTAQPFYEPAYGDSHALIIGIDKYQQATPLSFAANDARGISVILEKQFSFHQKEAHYSLMMQQADQPLCLLTCGSQIVILSDQMIA